jgi:peptide/nickel transport system substrate-binding protein
MKRIFILALSALSILSCSKRKPVLELPSSAETLIRFEDALEIQPGWPAKNTLVYHTISEPDNLHPTNGNSAPRLEILTYTQKTLLTVDYASQSIIPSLVEKLPDISADGLSYTYTLKSGPVWDNNKPVTSEDISFTAKAYKCPLTNDHAVRSYWDNVSDVITYENKNQFTIVMKKKLVQNISLFTSFPVMQRSFFDPEKILSRFSFSQFEDTMFQAPGELSDWALKFNDDKYGRNPDFLNGLGAYIVERWETGQYITLVRKKDHWSRASVDYHDVAYPEKIIFRLNKDENSQMLQFRSQETDVSLNMSVNTFRQLNQSPGFSDNYNSIMMPTYNYTYVGMNRNPDGKNHQPFYNDVNVRKALALLIPVDNIIKLVYKDYSNQCRRMITNVSPLKKEFNDKLKPVQYDFQQAVEKLHQSGWSDSDNDGVLDKNIKGKKINFITSLNYLNTSPDWKEIAMLITEELNKAGIRVEPVPMDFKLFAEKAKAHDYDLMLGSWGGTALPEDYTQLWHTSSIEHGSNYAGFGNAQSDMLIDSIKAELDENKRAGQVHRLQEMIYDDQPYVFLYCNLRRCVIHKRFANQMLFSERPGILLNMLRLLSINSH